MTDEQIALCDEIDRHKETARKLREAEAERVKWKEAAEHYADIASNAEKAEERLAALEAAARDVVDYYGLAGNILKRLAEVLGSSSTPTTLDITHIFAGHVIHIYRRKVGSYIVFTFYVDGTSVWTASEVICCHHTYTCGCEVRESDPPDGLLREEHMHPCSKHGGHE